MRGLYHSVSMTRFLIKHLGSWEIEVWRGVRLELRSFLGVQGETDESLDWVISVGERNELKWCLRLQECNTPAAPKGTSVVNGGFISECKAQSELSLSSHPPDSSCLRPVCMLLPVEPKVPSKDYNGRLGQPFLGSWCATRMLNHTLTRTFPLVIILWALPMVMAAEYAQDNLWVISKREKRPRHIHIHSCLEPSLCRIPQPTNSGADMFTQVSVSQSSACPPLTQKAGTKTSGVAAFSSVLQ